MSVAVLLRALGALIIAGSAFGDSVPLTFTGVNGATAFGYYVGPYSGTIEGNPVTLYCDDFANEVYFGESWLANLTSLAGSDLSNTRYGDLPDALTLYREAAWLTTQYEINPNAYGDIQATIWQLFDLNAPSPGSNKWFDLAAANYKNVDFSRFDVVTNVNVAKTGQVQEFLIDPAPVPEPSAILLLATVLVCVAVVFRRRIWSRTGCPSALEE
jgi:PEP-CTERM motif